MIFGFDKNTPEGVWEEFDGERWEWDKPKTPMPEGINILWAFYGDTDYEGWAHVLFTDADGQLQLVNGGHCSCFGLEGQWEPTPTSWEAVAKGLVEGEFREDYITSEYDPEGAKAARQALVSLVESHVGPLNQAKEQR